MKRFVVVLIVLWMGSIASAALTCTLTRLPCVAHSDGLVTVGFNVVLEDDSVEVVNTSISTRCDKSTDIGTLAPYFIKRIQWIIDKYKREKTVNNHTKYATLQSTVEAGITVED